MNPSPLRGPARIEPLEARIAPAFTSGTLNVSGLFGANGSTFNGATSSDASGASVDVVGDVNGDGFADFTISTANTATVYVLFGRVEEFPADVSLGDLSAIDGFQITGVGGGADAGDVNGDGFDDLIVLGGSAHVIFGRASGFPAQLAVSTLDGGNGFTLTGAATAARGAGDVNGDGFDDVILGNEGAEGTGAAFLFFGKPGAFTATVNVTTLTSGGTKLAGVASDDFAGSSVNAAGDVNGDGFDDVIVGAPGADEGGTSRGAAYVVFGSASLPTLIQLGGLTGANGFKLKGGADRDSAGLAVSGAGDVNGDGFADVIVGAPGVGNTGVAATGLGAAYVVFGHAGSFLTPIDLSTLAGTGFELSGLEAGDQTGRSVSGAGDVNGDGFDDVIVGTVNGGGASDPGTAYVVFGEDSAFLTPPNLATLDGTNGFTIVGESGGGEIGRNVGGGGDVNGDGFADVILGFFNPNAGGGASYLIRGGPSGTFITADVTTDGKSATFTDIDGDLVTIKTTKGTLFPNSIGLIAPDGADGSRALFTTLELGVDFDGADLTITAKRSGGGNGKVNLGFLNASGVDLGKVTISGDLGRIVAGDGDDDPGLKSLTVGSLGLFGGRTGDTGTGSGSVFSTVRGPVGAVKIAGDMQGATFSVVAAATFGASKVASLTIGGSLVGGKIDRSGSFVIDGALGPVRISGDLLGGSGEFSGVIETLQGIASVTIGGNLAGDLGHFSGRIRTSGSIGNITLVGSLAGGDGQTSGSIFATGSIAKVSIHGNLTGGAGNLSALIQSGSASIASVTIGGDARTGTGDRSGTLLAGETLGPVTIGGDVIGTEEVPFVFRATGPLTGPKSLAIAGVKVGGDLVHALVLGGYGTGDDPVNGHAQIGAITVGGDWIASSITAGLLPSANGLDANFGNGEDVFITGGPDGVVASIQSVTITGRALGTFEAGDRFAIVAERVGSVNVGGAKLPLTKSTTADPANDLAGIAVGATPDFVVREVSRTTPPPENSVFFFPTPLPGTDLAFPADLPLATLADADGFALNGIAGDDRAGDAVSNAGDVNGDGFDDLIVAAEDADSGRGAVYVVFGHAGDQGSFVLSELDGLNGFTLTGANPSVAGNVGDRAGSSVSGAGDINGDGFDDLIIGAPNVDTDFAANPSDNRGAAYVVFGRSSFAGTPSIALAALDGVTGFRLFGPAQEVFGVGAGSAVGGAGDVNGDGLDDVIVGAPASGFGSGAAFVVFGQREFANGPTPGFSIGLETLGGTRGFTIGNLSSGGDVGSAVSGAGDFNGDGFDDVLVGAPFRNGPGEAYVVFGKSSFGPFLSTNGITGAVGITLAAALNGGQAGNAVGPAGDVNGDGFADVIVGDLEASLDDGAAYVVFGRAATLAAPLGLGDLTGRDGFRLLGTGVEEAGGSVRGAGDVNGDGFSDLIVGTRLADPGSNSNAGSGYVVFGHALDFPATMALADLGGLDGFEIQGVAAGDFLGTAVSGAGDLNGDGFADVIVGSPSATGAAANSGAAFVVYGGPGGIFVDPTIAANGKTATWTDVDGDLVTLKISGTTASLTAANFQLLQDPAADDARLRLLSLTLGAAFDSANVSLTAKRAAGGDGKVNVGKVDAPNVDLGAVTIGGDLGSFRAGDADAGLAFRSLTVGSLGVFGARTQDTGGQLLSSTSGPAGALKILGDVRDAAYAAISSGVEPGSLVSVTIGGDVSGTGPLLGPSNLFFLGQIGPGTIAASDTIGPVKIGGDLVGGADANSGFLSATSIASVSLGGSLVGNDGQFSGAVVAGTVGTVTIGGDQRGGAGGLSGSLVTTFGLGNVSIRGDQIGGAGVGGLIFTQEAGANIASVTIGGDARGGDTAFSGGILAGGRLGPVVVKGDVIGTAAQAYTIRGAGPLTGTNSVAITSLNVGGDFDHALILAGYGANNVPTNGHAQIGAMSIGGDWIASSVSAGLLPKLGATSAIGDFGNGDDSFIAGGPSGVIASIASITIKGRALGTLETGDRFGIVAEQIGAVTIGSVKLALTGNPDNLTVGPTPDFFVHEVVR